MHDGFLQGYLSLKRQIVNLIGGEQKIFVTGHSLGAALAELCAIDFVAQGKSVEIYSFGTPR